MANWLPQFRSPRLKIFILSSPEHVFDSFVSFKMTQMGKKNPQKCGFLLNVFQASAAGVSDNGAARLLAGLFLVNPFN